MAVRERLLPWDSQPQEAAPVRRDTAIGASLVSLILPPQGPIDLLLPSRTITKNANCNSAPSDDGIAYSSSDANSGLFFPTGSFTTIVPAASPITFFARVYVAATGVRRVLAADWNSGGGSQSIAIQQSAANKWEVYSVAGTGGPLSAGTVTVGWHTVVVSQSVNGSAFLWVDGEYLGTLSVAGSRSSGANAAWLDSGAFTGSIGWSTNKASLLAIGEVAADDTMARAFHDAPWDQVFAPRQIWVPVSAGGGTPTLTVPDTSHAHTLDNVVLTSSTTLAVQDMAHGHALDAPTMSTGTALAVADSAHVHALDNVTLSTTGATSLTVADSLHGHALDAVGLTSQAYLAVADMLHAHALDGVTLTLGGVNLTVAELLHAHALDNTTLTLDTYLAVADALHVHTLDNVVLSTPGGTLDLILKILVNRQELNPATGTFTLYDNDGTTVLYTTNAWADAAGTVPYSGGALRRIDALF